MMTRDYSFVENPTTNFEVDNGIATTDALKSTWLEKHYLKGNVTKRIG